MKYILFMNFYTICVVSFILLAGLKDVALGRRAVGCQGLGKMTFDP